MKKPEVKKPEVKKPVAKKAPCKKPPCKAPALPPKAEAKKPEPKKTVATMRDHVIIAVHVTDRLKKVPQVQALLSKYGCNIKTRVGLHETNDNICSANGILLLEMFGEKAYCLKLADELNKIGGIEAKPVVFTHPV